MSQDGSLTSTPDSQLGPGQHPDTEGGVKHTDPIDLDRLAPPEFLYDPDGPPLKEQIVRAKIKGELARREMCRRNLIAFCERFAPLVSGEPYVAGWVHRDIARRLTRFMQAVERKERPRLLLLMPPRHGKSLLTSILFYAWVLGHHPEWRMMNVGYNEDLPVDFSKAIRDILNSRAYQLIFPRTKIPGNDRSASDWATTGRGGMRAAGLAGGITGHGAHIMGVDDPLKGQEESKSQQARDKLWDGFVANVRTRIQPGGGVLIIQTWWNDDDLAGRVQKMNLQEDEFAEYRDKYEVVSYPAMTEEDEYEYYDNQTDNIIRIRLNETEDIDEPYTEEQMDSLDYYLIRGPNTALHEERYSWRELMAIRADMPEDVWMALFQQNPVPDSGIYFKREDVYLVPQLPDAEGGQICTGWDFAVGEGKRNNFTCGTTLQQVPSRTLYVRNVRKFKADKNRISSKIIRAMVDEALFYINLPEPPYYTIAVEDGHIWQAMKDSVREAFEADKIPMSIIKEFTPVKDKEARATATQDKWERGQLRLPEKARWLASFIREFMNFPNAKDLDQVDSTTWAVKNLLELGPPRHEERIEKRQRDRYADDRYKGWRDRLAASRYGGRRKTHMSA